MKTQEIKVDGYERVIEADLGSHVTSIIAVHNTKLGPSLGGCRFYNYVTREDALTDALRLSEGMSYKSAMANLPLGGGKSVIAGDPQKVKTRELLEAYADFVNSLDGLYYTAKDVGIELEDLDIIEQKTKFIKGTSAKNSSGDPSPVTAYGVFQGIRASAQFLWRTNSVKGRKVIIQGLGHVGFELAKHLIEDGAVVHACEINTEALNYACKNYGIIPLDINGWQTTKADVFCPCAMGAVLDSTSIPMLANNGVQIICGGANNQLLDVLKDSQRVRETGMVYAPDYIVNAGGIINIACEFGGYSASRAIQMTSKIYDTTLTILERAKKQDKPTAVVSLEMAREKLGLA
ncbi:MAG: amino acid dehydrogenase [Deltaproteobacteria bacterium]|nr:amino acid dehydrogenase [Deltaproteobacteria bacterium]